MFEALLDWPIYGKNKAFLLAKLQKRLFSFNL